MAMLLSMSEFAVICLKLISRQMLPHILDAKLGEDSTLTSMSSKVAFFMIILKPVNCSLEVVIVYMYKYGTFLILYKCFQGTDKYIERRKYLYMHV